GRYAVDLMAPDEQASVIAARPREGKSGPDRWFPGSRREREASGPPVREAPMRSRVILSSWGYLAVAEPRSAVTPMSRETPRATLTSSSPPRVFSWRWSVG